MSVPHHLAIIPDGNRRWAKAHLLLPWQGHEEGVKRFWDISYATSDAGVKFMTFWAGSYGNLAKRSEMEVKVLFRLLSEELAKPKLLDDLTERQTQLKVYGEWEQFNQSEELKSAIENIQEQTKNFQNNQLTILFGYDGQREMLAALRTLKASGEDITAENLRRHLWTGNLPDVDYVIRTGGEPHWSAGFLMWQTANSQFYFTEDFWPDFSTDKLNTALDEFERRERRLGK